MERFWSKTERRDDGCLWWTAGTSRGSKATLVYGRFQESSWNSQYAHRMAYKLAKGPIPEGKMVLHDCDNTLCCEPDHLYLGTAQDNSNDAVRRGRTNRKLSDDQVREIRRRWADGEKQVDLAREFGVQPPAISRIVHRKRRPYVE